MISFLKSEMTSNRNSNKSRTFEEKNAEYQRAKNRIFNGNNSNNNSNNNNNKTTKSVTTNKSDIINHNNNMMPIGIAHPPPPHYFFLTLPINSQQQQHMENGYPYSMNQQPAFHPHPHNVHSHPPKHG